MALVTSSPPTYTPSVCCIIIQCCLFKPQQLIFRLFLYSELKSKHWIPHLIAQSNPPIYDRESKGNPRRPVICKMRMNSSNRFGCGMMQCAIIGALSLILIISSLISLLMFPTECVESKIEATTSPRQQARDNKPATAMCRNLR